MMEKEAQCDDLALKELLCFKVFSGTFHVICLDGFYKAITEWAERAVLAGRESDTLLILASLNLDPIPDRHEVEKYLGIYQLENDIKNPDSDYSALVWLRMQIQYLIHPASSKEIERILEFFIHYYFSDYSPRSFAKIAGLLSNLYWDLYDEAIPIFNSRASSMSDEELMIYVKQWCEPYYRVLINEDWLSILTKRQ
jgi:hypothetical protein